VSRANRLRLGAVGYLNARPLVYGLDRKPRFDLRYDVPSECARLLHDGSIDVGLIPSIEYLRGPEPYALVPGPAVTSRGPVASVALYTRVEPNDIRSIAMDSSSKTSVALATVMLRRLFGVTPEAVSMPPDLESMLARADAALIIGDYALFLDPQSAIHNQSAIRNPPFDSPLILSLSKDEQLAQGRQSAIQKFDLGELWTESTGLPFVYAFWAGWPDVVTPDDVEALQQARDEGVAHAEDVARAYYPDDPASQAVAARYLRDNIRYFLGHEELEGLRTFYEYAAELDLVPYDGTLRFYHAEHHGAR
jgi:chorismate dehydratase